MSLDGVYFFDRNHYISSSNQKQSSLETEINSEDNNSIALTINDASKDGNVLAKGVFDHTSVSAEAISTILAEAQSSAEVFGEPINVTTFNTYGYQNVNVDNEVNTLIQNNDIIGLQEPSFDELIRYAADNKDTHGVILGLENNGGEYAPIIFNKERFDVVHTESIHLPGNDNRAATFAVLRDKSTGALTVVGNTHLSSANSISDRVDNFDLVSQKVSDLTTQYGADGGLVLGDFNLSTSGSGFGDYSGQIPTFEHGGNIDGVLVLEADADATDPLVTDGGASDHNAVTRTVKFKYDAVTTQDNLDLPTIEPSRLNLYIDPEQYYQRSDEYNLEDAYGLPSSKPNGRPSVSESPHREYDIINDRPVFLLPPPPPPGGGR